MADSQHPSKAQGTAEGEDHQTLHTTALTTTASEATDGIGYVDQEEPDNELKVRTGEPGEEIEPATDDRDVVAQQPLHRNDQMYLTYFKQLLRHLTTEGVLTLMLQRLWQPSTQTRRGNFLHDGQNAALTQVAHAESDTYRQLLDSRITDAVERLIEKYVDPDGDDDTTVDMIDQTTLRELTVLWPVLSFLRDYLTNAPIEPYVEPRRWWQYNYDHRAFDRNPWGWLRYYYTQQHLNVF